jgi:hypothetical protein
MLLFTAVIRDGCAERGVSFSRVVRLIEGIGHVGKISGFTTKPMEQYSFLLTGFSRHTSSQSSPGGGTVPTAEAGCIHRGTTRTRHQEGRAIDAGALASRRSKPSISDDDGGLSDSESESSSDDDGCSRGDEQGRSSTSKHSRWDGIDEQRLLAYKKEDKSWDRIFKKFPGRTPAAVRTRWTMVQYNAKSNEPPPPGGQAAAQALCAYVLAASVTLDKRVQTQFRIGHQALPARALTNRSGSL